MRPLVTILLLVVVAAIVIQYLLPWLWHRLKSTSRASSKQEKG